MKFSAILASAACTFLFIFNSVVASPTSLQSRATKNNGVVIGYFPNWLYSNYLPSKIDFKKYTHIYYAFALQVAGNVPVWEDPEIMNENLAYGFPALVKAARAAGTEVMISVGGWTGSTKFSPMAASKTGRAEFIKWNVDLVTKFDLAGVDLDWEYPTGVGPGCNTISLDDVKNLLSLVKELRIALNKASPKKYREITMAVRIVPWSSENIVTDVSEFVPFVDRFHVMTFDVNGSWDPISGPNSPFQVEKGKGFQYGFVEGINYWNKAGVPYNKIAGGVAFYGRSRTLTGSSAPKTQYNPAAPKSPLGDKDDGPWTNPYCPADTSAASGQWKYRNLRSQGVLKSPTTAAAPWVRNFDKTTKTPWLYNPETKVYLTYDDPISIGAKTDWAVKKGLAGLFAWSLDQDYNSELVAAMQPVRKNSGAPRPSSSAATKTKTTKTNTTKSNTTKSNTTKTKTTKTKTTKSKTTKIKTTKTKTTKPKATKTKTRKTTTTRSSSAITGKCKNVSAYKATISYTGGKQVTYGGELYKAKWWTKGETPSRSSSVWSYVGKC